MALGGNTILITGGGSGIGLELARTLAAQGNSVVIAGRRQALLDAAAAEIPGIRAMALDIADAASVADFAARVVRDHPGLNMVIHNAGVMVAETLSAAPTALSIAEETVAINLLGPIRLTHALLPHLAARPRAAILTVSSGLAFVPLAATPTYSATKAAIHSWTQSLRHQLRGTGIAVAEIAPPGVQTDLMPGHAENPQMMPLDDFIAETMAMLNADPIPDEVLVARVRVLRDAEAEGRHAAMFAALNDARH